MAMFCAMPGSADLADDIARLTGGSSASVEARRFPDGESLVRVPAGVAGQDLFLVCRMSPPDEQLLPVIFAARTARSNGARTVKLIAPYLPYLRQDKVFHPGEALSSTIFADLLDREFDGLVTVDPHLHRFSSLAEIYTMPTTALSAAALIGRWVRDHVSDPVILGPDGESRQWAEAVAKAAGAPWSTFHKARTGDREVQLTAPDLAEWQGRLPVLVDDIVSSGATVEEAARQLGTLGFAAPVCVAVHGLFDSATGRRLEQLTSALVTTDTISNPYSSLIVAPLIATALGRQELSPGAAAARA